MRLRTEIKSQSSHQKIAHNDGILLLGSCFSLEMGSRLSSSLFDVMINPFGTVYNSYSIRKLVERSVDQKMVQPGEIQYNVQSMLYFHYDFHSSFSGSTVEEVVIQCNRAIKATYDYLQKCKYIFITLGTSFVFEEKEEGVVANCHKVPNHHFTKRLLSVEEQYTALESMITRISRVNKDANIILTVSPVRHTKEGLQDNQLSKSIVRITEAKIIENFDQCSYFPSYEIVLDDLRDYRFYKPDLIHPNELAVDYIWEQFGTVFFDEEVKKINQEITKLIQAVSHRTMNPSSDASRQHKVKTIERIELFQKMHPQLPLVEFLKTLDYSIL